MPLERAIARAIISRLVPEGLSYNRIIRYVQTAGYGYRRGEMLSDIREIGGFYEHQAQFRLLSPNQAIPRAYMTETDLVRPYNYRVLGEATYYDEGIDDYVTETRSYYTDEINTTSSAEADFLEHAPRTATDPLAQYMGFEVTQVQHNQGLPY